MRKEIMEKITDMIYKEADDSYKMGYEKGKSDMLINVLDVLDGADDIINEDQLRTLRIRIKVKEKVTE